MDGYRLVPFEPGSRALYESRLSDPETYQPYNWHGFDYTGAPSSAALGTTFGENGFLAVVNEREELVGSVQWIPGFWLGGPNRNRAWNIGVLIFPEHRRTRATRAAVQLLIDYLFVHTTAHRIEAATGATAPHYERGYGAVGMRKEGLFREAQWREGAWRDVVVIAILRSEWEARRAGQDSVHAGGIALDG